MLIPKKICAGDIVTMKLVNGDEIVAELIADELTYYEIRRPQTVVPSAKGMGLMPTLFTAKDDVTAPTMHLSKQHVMLAAPSVDEMAKHYTTVTTGIVPVTAGSIIT